MVHACGFNSIALADDSESLAGESRKEDSPNFVLFIDPSCPHSKRLILQIAAVTQGCASLMDGCAIHLVPYSTVDNSGREHSVRQNQQDDPNELDGAPVVTIAPDDIAVREKSRTIVETVRAGVIRSHYGIQKLFQYLKNLDTSSSDGWVKACESAEIDRLELTKLIQLADQDCMIAAELELAEFCGVYSVPTVIVDGTMISARKFVNMMLSRCIKEREIKCKATILINPERNAIDVQSAIGTLREFVENVEVIDVRTAAGSGLMREIKANWLPAYLFESSEGIIRDYFPVELIETRYGLMLPPNSGYREFAAAYVFAENERSLEIWKEDVDFYIQGSINLLDGKDELAMVDFEKHLEVKPHDVRALNNLASILSQQNDRETDAIKLWAGVLRAAGEHRKALDNLYGFVEATMHKEKDQAKLERVATELARNGYNVLAEHVLDAALARNPGSVRLRVALAKQGMRSDPEQALALLESIPPGFEPSVDTLLVESEALRRLGRSFEERQTLERARSLDARDDRVLERIEDYRRRHFLKGRVGGDE